VFVLVPRSLLYVNVRSKPILAVRYESQVYTAIWSEQLNREEKEIKRKENLNIRGKEITCNEPSFPITEQGTCLLAQGGP
jgi:hypothetical protein